MLVRGGSLKGFSLLLYKDLSDQLQIWSNLSTNDLSTIYLDVRVCVKLSFDLYWVYR